MSAPPGAGRTLGAIVLPSGAVRFRLASARATRVELSVYATALAAPAALTRVLAHLPGSDYFEVVVEPAELQAAGVTGTIYYGYRVWGPNWPWDAGWQPGSLAGWVADVDSAGNRMNPNKLLFDPYALELSHDPVNPAQLDGRPYRVGGERAVDSGPVAPKGIVLVDEVVAATATRPTRALRDDVIYEVHLRGLTRNDAAAGACAGTYAAAAARAPALAALGVTALELLPLQETQNDANDVVPDSAAGDNYWGYSTLSYFAPDRRYACDRTPGGPTRELRAMVEAFHAVDIKVFVDVVYNHTAEGGGSSLLSLRGLDNATYYQLAADATRFQDNTGIGASTNARSALFRDLVIDSLRYWQIALGVDGFRFDLAPILGNGCDRGCFRFDRDDGNGVLRRAVRELPARGEAGGAGVDLIAEPWGIGAGTYQIGNFPPGWAEWNGQYRDLVRQDQNQLGVTAVTPGWLSARLAGSPELFGDDGRRPWHSVNYLVSHDGFTLRDLYACAAKRNDQPWPSGPSNGGDDDNKSWDHGGDPVRQRQAARTGMALLLLSAGVPMFTGGDELLRSQACNNNPYNLDSPAIWLENAGEASVDEAAFATFVRRLISFRRAHAALRPLKYWSGTQVTWHDTDAARLAGAAMDDANRQFLGMRLDGAALGDSARAIYVAYNGDDAAVRITLPAPGPSTHWYRAADTAPWLEDQQNIHEAGAEYRMQGTTYDLAERSLALFVER